MMVLFFTHIPFVVNHTINATQPERLQQLETRLESESFEPLIDFLAFLVQKL